MTPIQLIAICIFAYGFLFLGFFVLLSVTIEKWMIRIATSLEKRNGGDK